MQASNRTGPVPAKLALTPSVSNEHARSEDALEAAPPQRAAHERRAYDSPTNSIATLIDGVVSTPNSARSATFAAFAPPGTSNPALFLPSDSSSMDGTPFPIPPHYPRRPPKDESAEPKMAGPTPLHANLPARPTRSALPTRPPYMAAAAAASDQRTQLQVRNLPYSVRWQDVKDLFRRAGTVLRADVHLTPENRSCGAGTVLFATEEDALHAVDTMHGYMWQGRVLDVQLERDVASVHSSRASSALGFSAQHSSRSSVAHDETARTPSSAHFPSVDGVPVATARAGVQTAPDTPWLPPAPSGPKAQPGVPFQGRVLFIGNLPFHCQWQDLKDLFRAAGNIQRADVALNADGRSRGFGTVLFAAPEDAQNAVRLYHGYEYSGRILKVHFDRLAQYGSTQSAALTEPSQYTAAFSEHSAPPNETEPSLAPPPAADGAALKQSAHLWHDAGAYELPMPPAYPGPITLPSLPFTAPTRSHPPAMPGFAMRPGAASPSLYPARPNADMGFPLSGDAPPFVHGGMPPFTTAVPSEFSMPHSAFFPRSGALPSTPHWSQPVRSGARGASLVRTSSQGTRLQSTPGAARTAHASSEYPFPDLEGATASAAADEPRDPPAAPGRVTNQTTKELTEAIAQLSVQGAARTSDRAGTGEVREAAQKAISQLRNEAAAPATANDEETTPSTD